MAENFDGIWELRLFYTVTPTGFLPLQHRNTLDVAVDGDISVGELFSDINVTNRNFTVQALSDFCDDYIALLEEIYAPTATFNRFELFKIPEGTYDAEYFATYEIGTVGVAGAPNIAAAQTTFTFRTQGGGSARCQLMECYDGSQSKVSPPYAAGGFADLAAFLVAPTSPVQGRDNSYLIANLHWSSGQNEKLWRKRYRS